MAEPGRCTDLVLLFFDLDFMSSQQYDIQDFPKIQCTDSTKKIVRTVWNRSNQVISPSVSLLCSACVMICRTVCLFDWGRGWDACTQSRAERQRAGRCRGSGLFMCDLVHSCQSESNILVNLILFFVVANTHTLAHSTVAAFSFCMSICLSLFLEGGRGRLWMENKAHGSLFCCACQIYKWRSWKEKK